MSTAWHDCAYVLAKLCHAAWQNFANTMSQQKIYNAYTHSIKIRLLPVDQKPVKDEIKILKTQVGLFFQPPMATVPGDSFFQAFAQRIGGSET